jgi:hypothetical protein
MSNGPTPLLCTQLRRHYENALRSDSNSYAVREHIGVSRNNNEEEPR